MDGTGWAEEDHFAHRPPNNENVLATPIIYAEQAINSHQVITASIFYGLVATTY